MSLPFGILAVEPEAWYSSTVYLLVGFLLLGVVVVGIIGAVLWFTRIPKDKK